MLKELSGKKVIIYGTGKIAERLIDNATFFGYSIIGLLDRYLLMGELKSIPILSWEDLKAGDAYAVVIAALEMNQRQIFDRIRPECSSRNMLIYSFKGENLSKKEIWESISPFTVRLFRKNEDEIIEKINEADVVSFDMFDTMVMRKTLEPIDLFDIVDRRIRKKDIVINKFKCERRRAELEAHGANIYEIYKKLKSNLGLDEKTALVILEEELRCEKENIIPRKRMINILNKAKSLGKEVCIISDMYLPTAIISEILKELGVKGIDRIYVSCEYGTGKGGSLFEIFLKDHSDKKCLHIGDDYQVDYMCAMQSGLNAYHIPNALEMLRVSNFSPLLYHTNSFENRVLIGRMIADIFNDPFALYGNAGCVSISNVDSYIRWFIFPIAALYIKGLIKVLEDNPVDGVLFGARDGYLMKQLYDKYFSDRGLPASFYFLTSRKSAIKSDIRTEEDFSGWAVFFGGENKLKNYLYDMEDVSFQESFFSRNADNRKGYIKYLEKSGIDKRKTFLLCDLVAAGTVSIALSGLFEKSLLNYCLVKFIRRNKDNYDAFETLSRESYSGIISNYYILEEIFTSLDPSIEGFDLNGSPIYSSDERSAEELEFIRKAQEIIMAEADNWLSDNGGIMSEDLSLLLFELSSNTILTDEAGILDRLALKDDMTKHTIRMRNSNGF